MNKIIKFRIWDNYLSEWVTNKKFNFYPFNNEFLLAGAGDYESKSRYIIHQFTGVKDVNGKDVYEGDIIKSLFGSGVIGFKDRITVVKWDIIHGYKWSYHIMETIEVVGNIMETPDLEIHD
jgi:hypothetical protein